MSKLSPSDEIVAGLLKKIDDKKAAIGSAERPAWRTTCAFAFDPGQNSRINLQTIPEVGALVEIHAFLRQKQEGVKESAKELGLAPSFSKYKYMGFALEDWLSDVKTRISGLLIKTQRDELADLEKRVSALVSPEHRREIELAKLIQEIDKK